MENKRQIGISIYPSNQKILDMKKYIDKAYDFGYSRIFSSMLEINENDKIHVLDKFTEIFSYARKKGFDVCLDVNPRIFKIIGASPSDLSIFNKLNASTVRLDMPMDGKSEAEMTFNPYNLNIEINVSNGTNYISNILSYKPKKDNLIACHNFYPQKNTGLKYEFFLKSTKLAKKYGIRTAAFVSSKNANQGPWEISDGLPTVEIHRNKDISVQAKNLWATDLIDDIIIGNAYASEEELKNLSEIDRYKINLNINLLAKTSKIERRIIELDTHFRRGDLNDFSIRSTMSRVWFKEEKFPEHDNEAKQKKGDIFIGNNNFGIYKGELQLTLNNSACDNRKNLVARVIEEELFLIDYIDSWSKFKFTINKTDSES